MFEYKCSLIKAESDVVCSLLRFLQHLPISLKNTALTLEYKVNNEDHSSEHVCEESLCNKCLYI